MLEQIKAKMQNEQVQRAVLQTVGMIGGVIVTSVFSQLLHKGIETGIDALMEKMHPTTTEIPAE